MRDFPGESRSRAAALRTRAARLLGARAQRVHRAGDRNEEPRSRTAHLLRSDPPARYREHAVSVDPAALPLRLHARLPGGDVRTNTTKPGRAAVTPLARLLRERIARSGPIPFRRFMEMALYHPEHGYYRRGRDPFGPAGDFYTAEQL